jgi:hypothetical protein
MVVVAEGVDVFENKPSRRQGGKILLITCQSFVPIVDEERKERKVMTRVILGIYVSTTNTPPQFIV